jgi:hypothetical protein
MVKIWGRKQCFAKKWFVFGGHFDIAGKKVREEDARKTGLSYG